jgi:O-succinylhomoserine sulfhydrylase
LARLFSLDWYAFWSIFVTDLSDVKKQQTIAVRGGINRSPEGEHCEPIYTTSSFVYGSAAEAAAVFSGKQQGNVYSRYTNPTVTTLEQRIAEMEGAEAAVATASGMAAILSIAMATLKTGDHVLCSRSVFGTTTGLFKNYLQKMGIEVSFVSLVDADAWRETIQPNTKLLFVESPSNPLCEIADIYALSELAHTQDAILVVDNTYCTPVLQNPLALGADVVVYSGTKYLDGQGRALGGLVLGSEALMAEVLAFIRTAGPSISPFNAWIMLKGLETLSLRMRAHSENAMQLASWLDDQEVIEHVYYPGLYSHPQRQLIEQQQRHYGGVLSFKVRGGREQAWRLVDATEMMSITGNLGDAKTTIIHPATTTHGKLSDEERQLAGITENLIRVSVGLEDIEDLINDMQRGIDAL